MRDLHIWAIMTVFPVANPDHRGTMHIPVAAVARQICKALAATDCFTVSLPTERCKTCGYEMALNDSG